MRPRRDPPRLRELLRGRADPLAAALEPLRDEEPSAENLRRVTLGVRLAVGASAAAAVRPSGSEAAGPAGSGGTSSGAVGGAAAGAKWISSLVVSAALGALTGGVVIATLTHVVPKTETRSTPAPSAQAPVSSPRNDAPATAAAGSAVASSGAAMPWELVPKAPETPPPRSTSLAPTRPKMPPPAPSVGPFEDPGAALLGESAPPPTELALVTRAQEALAYDPDRALDLVREHERRFGLGALAQEREVIAIDALLRLGRKREAESRAQDFHRLYPRSAHGRRIDVLLQTSTP